VCIQRDQILRELGFCYFSNEFNINLMTFWTERKNSGKIGCLIKKATKQKKIEWKKMLMKCLAGRKLQNKETCVKKC
jgi:hypothetical protein